MVFKRILPNGLTVLVSPQYHIPKVSLQLWYAVGSKNEKSGEKGIAHLIEHMIFKGTSTLSESDINLIVHKLSGSCNAFTSHDYTGYLFDLPVHNWRYALPIMADCMSNCLFKEELLNSELKAVIQELKMYNDDYTSLLFEGLMEGIFHDHPYNYPVIGYKQDLWQLKRETLVDFYHAHYMPNNATLVVVGAVKPEEVIVEVERAFGAITPRAYLPREFYHSSDIAARTLSLYRDIQQPVGILAWTVPGAAQKLDYLLDTVSWVLGGGKGSRLTHLLVDKYQLATEFETFVYDLFEYGLFAMTFQPRDRDAIPRIIDVVEEELEALVRGGLEEREVVRAAKKTEMDFLSVAEDNQKHAYLLGKYYLATKDEQYLDQYCNYPQEKLAQDIPEFVAEYLRSAVMHRGFVFPLVESEKKYWIGVQEQSDAEDARVLERVVREAEVEPGVHVHTITPGKEAVFPFPKYESCELKNGLSVLYAQSALAPKIEIILDFKTKYYCDPDDKQGLQMFLMDMLQEGTKDFSTHDFHMELESYGMSLSLVPGQITMSLLSKDLPKALRLLFSLLSRATLPEAVLDKVRKKLVSDVIDFWDTPAQFVGQLARNVVYKNHPFSKSALGTMESILRISHDDIVEAYRRAITPQGAKLIVVGDFAGQDVCALVEAILGEWSGGAVEELHFPPLVPVHAEAVNYPIVRDQLVLAYAGLSVKRLDPDYDKLLLFDQILTGGVLGSMSSRLFDLRERSGLFYTIGGSLVLGSYVQPGMIFIKTVVSHDHVARAEQLIMRIFEKQASDITESELQEAKSAISNSLIDNFASYRQMAQAFLFLETLGLPHNFFDTRAQQLNAISLDEVRNAVARHLITQQLATIKVGRL